MTVKELISNCEEVKDLDAVCITRNHCTNLYIGDDIDYIDKYTLGLPVKKSSRENFTRNNRIRRVLNIEC